MKATKNIKNKKTEAGMIEMVSKALSPAEVSLLLYCGLLHTKKYNNVEELEEDMGNRFLGEEARELYRDEAGSRAIEMPTSVPDYDMGQYRGLYR